MEDLMSTYRSSIRLPARRWCRPGLGLLALLWLAACGVADQPMAGASAATTDVESPRQAATVERQATATSAPDMGHFATTGAPTAEGGYPIAITAPATWQSYRNEQAGYSVEYPAGWTASEQDWGNGTSSVTFAPGGGSSITIVTQAGEIPLEADELPNTRCQEITVGGLPARRCTDTLSFTTSTTVVGQGKTYIITTSSKHMDEDIYQHVLDSFTIVS
jgi:hypothetical protein